MNLVAVGSVIIVYNWLVELIKIFSETTFESHIFIVHNDSLLFLVYVLA